jgi:hypothetical protein
VSILLLCDDMTNSLVALTQAESVVAFATKICTAVLRTMHKARVYDEHRAVLYCECAMVRIDT